MEVSLTPACAVTIGASVLNWNVYTDCVLACVQPTKALQKPYHEEQHFV